MLPENQNPGEGAPSLQEALRNLESFCRWPSEVGKIDAQGWLQTVKNHLAPAAPSLREAAIQEQDALERLQDIRYHLINIPPVLRNQATVEALGKVEGHIADLKRRPALLPSSEASEEVPPPNSPTPERK